MEQPGRVVRGSMLPIFWAYADAARRQQGELMEFFGLGPVTSACRVVRAWSVARLLAYQTPSEGPSAVLLVPAPIKASYIWDLAPDVSVVQRCLAAGLQVYLIDWQRPGVDDEEMGLAEYADRLIAECAQAIAAETGQSKIFIAGHSLGGTLAAIFASLHPAQLRGLIELEGPMYFSPDGPLESAARSFDSVRAITPSFGNVPGSFLSAASAVTEPVAFDWEPWLDWLSSVAAPQASRTYARVRRWTLDETPMPRRLFEEVVGALYREDEFARRRLTLGGRLADPQAITAPILAVADPRSRVVPPVSMEAYRHQTASADVQILQYEGDVGVMLQHVGVLVGEVAHKTLWPKILAWIDERRSRQS